MVSISLILGLLITGSAFGIEGKYASAEKELRSTCKLVFQVWDVDKKKIAAGICSSSFIGNKSFLTAEHCHDTVEQAQADYKNKLTKTQPYFQCPGSEKQYKVLQTQGFRTSGQAVAQDLGVMKVKEAINIRPVELPADAEEANELLAKNKDCFLSGYGYDNDQKYGTLKAASVDTVDVNKNSPKATIRGNLGVHGDSGGPVYCITDRGPVVVGVIQGGLRGIRATDVDKITTSLTWLVHGRNSKKTVLDSDKEVSLYEDITETCESVNQCRDKMVEAHKLTKDLEAVIKKLNEQVEVLGVKIKDPEGPGRVQLEKTWKDLVAVWEKEGCYKVIYPE